MLSPLSLRPKHLPRCTITKKSDTTTLSLTTPSTSTTAPSTTSMTTSLTVISFLAQLVRSWIRLISYVTSNALMISAENLVTARLSKEIWANATKIAPTDSSTTLCPTSASRRMNNLNASQAWQISATTSAHYALMIAAQALSQAHILMA